MKSSPILTRSHPASLEILEARIAPARVITVGVPDILGGSGADNVNYDSPNFFVDTVNGVATNDPISLAVGSYTTGTGMHPHETFYLKLGPGDSVESYVSGGGGETNTLLKIRAGQAVAFFEDLDHNNEVSQDELVSISVGRGASIIVQGALAGNIVGDLNAAGTIDLNDLVSTQQSIGAISMGGFAVHDILAAGNISNVTAGNVHGIFAGSSALGKSFSFFPNLSNGGTGNVGTITSLSSGATTLLPAPGVAGASIFNVAADSVATEIHAGDGGFGAAGGSLTSLQLLQETTAFSLLAGAGGNSDAAHRNGGAGGGIVRVFISGFTDNTASDVVQIHAGAGGNSTTGVGGRGGGLNTIYVGASLLNGVPTFSDDFAADDYAITGGNGGNGASGGAGGALSLIRVVTNTPVDNGLAGKGLLHELTIQAGTGGNSLATVAGRGLHAGAGGSVTNVIAIDQLPQPVPFTAMDGATAAILAGDAGTVATANGAHVAVGAAGGSIVTASLLAPRMIFTGGDGSEGTVGGAGGALSGVRVLQQGTIFGHSLIVDAGNGGLGTVGNGGSGGNINGLFSVDGDFVTLNINNTGGNGGASLGRFGGRGGSITNMDLLDSNSQRERVDLDENFGNFSLHTGTGGAGKMAGGAGGSLVNGAFEGENINVAITAGNGGVAMVSGSGGAGGSIRSLRVNVDGSVDEGRMAGHVPTAATAVVTSGTGGNGVLNGGAGGLVASTLIRVFDDLAIAASNAPVAGGDSTLIAGDGGKGDTANGGLRGKPGTGGSILTSGVYAETGSGYLRAGNAGLGGVTPAAGGSIRGTSAKTLSGLYAAESLIISAGDGFAGGAGGSLVFVGYGAPTEDLLPVPRGNILVTAGAGSAYHSTTGGRDFAGAGGSILNLFGTVSGSADTTTAIRAGAGGAVAGGTKAGAGGSIAGLTIERGPVDGVPASLFTIDAGDAGEATLNVAQTSVAAGAKGGSVSGVTIRANIGDGTVLRSIAAGDAGPGTAAGGVGGSIVNVRVEGHDIGLRSGAAFGYDNMGGLFAGKGGDGVTRDGIAGSVLNVSADSISSIVAGKFLTGVRAGQFDLATTVAGIKLNQTNDLSPTLGTSFTDDFQFTFHPVLAQTAAAGNDQTFERIPTDAPGGPTTFVLTYKGQSTVPLDADASATEIMDALAALPTPPPGLAVAEAANNFTVTHTDAATAPITGLGSQSTAPLHGNARPRDVQAALNQLAAATATNDPNYPGFPVATVVSSDAASFVITYTAKGARGNLSAERLLTDRATTVTNGDLNTMETQHLQLLGTGQFSVDGSMRLNSGAPANGATPAGASPMDVEAAINSVPGHAPVTVTAGDEPNSYDIHFTTAGDQPLIEATEYANLLTTVTTPGTATTSEVQAVNFTSLIGANDLVFRVGADTIRVPADHTTSQPPTAQQVEDALNADAAVTTAGGVDVVLGSTNTFQITFRTPANAIAIDAVEVLPTHTGAIQPTTSLPVAPTDNSPNDGTSRDVQSFVLDDVADSFAIGFSDTAQTNLPKTATASDVQAALQALADASAGTENGGTISVQGGSGNFLVTFGNDQHQEPLVITEFVNQSQIISVSNQGTFTLTTAANQTTVPLSPNATGDQVEAALNQVLPANMQVAVTNVPGEHGVFLIKYLDGMNDPAPIITDTQPLITNTPSQGVVTLSYARQVTFDPDTIATSSILGAIAQFNQLSSDVFNYFDVNGDGTFDLGDRAFDGFVGAKNFSQQTVNTTPQARLVINSDVNSARPGLYRPVNPAAPTQPQFFDFRNDNLF